MFFNVFLRSENQTHQCKYIISLYIFIYIFLLLLVLMTKRPRYEFLILIKQDTTTKLISKLRQPNASVDFSVCLSFFFLVFLLHVRLHVLAFCVIHSVCVWVIYAILMFMYPVQHFGYVW